MKRKQIVLTTIAVLLLASCQNQEVSVDTDTRNQIVASIDNPASRTVVDDETGAESGAIGVMWTNGDKIGVFDYSANAQMQYDKVVSGTAKTSNFRVASGTAFTNPLYAYYPYESNNNNKDVDHLTGTVLTTQSMDDVGTLQSDYKIGYVKSSSDNGHYFEFRHLFSLARFTVNASSTPLAGKSIRSLKISAKRGTNDVAIAGAFNFSAKSGEWQQSGTGSNSITLTWSNGKALTTPVQCYMSLFPTIKAGDELTITIETTDGFKTVLTATSKLNFDQETVYNFPLMLINYRAAKYYNAGGTEIQPTETTGSFTCAALNVDGLPDISYVWGSLNPDGPGAEGTTTIGTQVNTLGWDFVAVSEDFEYHTQLDAAMSSNYKSAKWRGKVTAAQLASRADTDGLGFFWKNGITATGDPDNLNEYNETWIQYTSEYGGLTAGANTCIKKGFRHFVVTIATGVAIDVYITHMNTYSGSGTTAENLHWKAQIEQLEQLRNYVVAKAKANNRPAIIMGDTNMRYTRHSIQTTLIDNVSSEGLKIVDPWIAQNRGGIFPAFETKSLMIRSKFNGDANDILCSDDQRGEVVDKMWYINVPGAPLQIEATSCMNDVEHFIKSREETSYTGVTEEDANGEILENQSVTINKKIGYADHFPVVVTFDWTKISFDN
ncbi:MAG: hypothetical protein HUJ98_04395 [Bacteroidaceae bacterium]|nr:hypothetical protein [Bacteroidaceae bacterium]